MALTWPERSVGLNSPQPGRGVEPLGLRRLTFAALGTRCEVQYAVADDRVAQEFAETAQCWVQHFEGRCTRFRRDSVIGRINADAGGGQWHDVDEEMERYFDVCAGLHHWSQGLLDATAGPLERLWDYRAAHPRVPTDGEIGAARRLVGWTRVERKPGAIRLPERGMELDFGGWGKEYAVDQVVRMAREHGLESALVDFGHDLAAFGAPPGRPAWHVGLEDPARPGRFSGSVALMDGGIAGSGDYQRGFTIDGHRYGHIIDVRSGRPAEQDCRQVTVVAGTCLQAGVLATTAFILGPREGMQLIQDVMGVEGRIVTSDAVHQSRGFFHHVVV